MFKDQVYEPCEMAALFKTTQHIGLNLRPVSPSISERTLLISVLHMMLGLPSDIFYLHNNTFHIKKQLLQLSHITHQAISKLMTFFIRIGNQMNFLRQYIRQVTKCQHKILEAFGIGLQKKVIQFENDLSQRLKILQQQQGQIIRNESQYHKTRDKPTTIIGLSVSLAAELQIIFRITSIIELLPPLTKLTTEDYQNVGVFLLNIYYQECQKQYLTGMPFKLHSVFGQCLKVYLQLCKAWISLSEKELLANKNIGFFVDLNIALSIEKQKMFDSKKTVKREKIPNFINSNYKHIFQLGKTVQFIKLYFKQQQLMQFVNFFDIQKQFKPVQQFVANLISSNITYFSIAQRKRKPNTISQRISKSKAPNKTKIHNFENNPFGINQQPSQFFYLRSQIVESMEGKQLQTSKIQEMKKNTSINDEKLSVNEGLIMVMNEAMNKLSFKCQAILKKSKIKDSIQQTLRGIKQFILLGQGDFVQQFLELSQTLLQKPIDKISRNNVERIIQEAIKNSAAHKQPEQMRQSVTFSFVRLDQASIKGWRAFSLAFKSQTPVTCIFNAQSMQGYESIGNLLFNLRRCEQILVSYWRKSFLGKAAKFMQARNAIHHFVCALQSYLFAQIQQTWCSLLTQFESCDSVLSLIQANETTLQALRELTVENKPLCSSMLSLVKIIDRLQYINKQCEEDHEVKVISDLEQIWSWFLSMLDQAKQIRNFADSFDFKLNY